MSDANTMYPPIKENTLSGLFPGVPSTNLGDSQVPSSLKVATGSLKK